MGLPRNIVWNKNDSRGVFFSQLVNFFFVISVLGRAQVFLSFLRISRSADIKYRYQYWSLYQIKFECDGHFQEKTTAIRWVQENSEKFYNTYCFTSIDSTVDESYSITSDWLQVKGILCIIHMFQNSKLTLKKTL